MNVHFDNLSIEEFFQYGGQVINRLDGFKLDVFYFPYIFENDFNEILKVNPEYFKNPENFECKIFKDKFEYDWKTETFYNKTYIDIRKYEVPKNDPLNIPNVCFSLVGPDDPEDRQEKFQKQRIERGFDDTELWNLDYTMMKFMYPRIKAFRENTCGWPGSLESEEEWFEILDKILGAFDIFLNQEDDLPTCTASSLKALDYLKRRPDLYPEGEYDRAVDRWKRFHEGWDLLHKWFFWLAD